MPLHLDSNAASPRPTNAGHRKRATPLQYVSGSSIGLMIHEPIIRKIRDALVFSHQRIDLRIAKCAGAERFGPAFGEESFGHVMRVVEDNLADARAGAEPAYAKSLQGRAVRQARPGQEVQRQDNGLHQLLDDAGFDESRYEDRIG